MKQTDYLVIGSGIAGLVTAYLLSEFGDVLVVSKGKQKENNTYWAQGGVAAVMRADDSFNSHAEDTMKVGFNHNHPRAVRHLVENGPKAIRLLESIGLKFDKHGEIEAGHSKPRVWRTSDFTGRDILEKLLKVTKKKKNITFVDETDAVELIVHENECRGVFVREGKKETLEPYFSKYTILATGGLGQLYSQTTNSLGSSGDGLALALNAGLELKDLEFMQFHPTAFAKQENNRHFLLSETLRGFGAHIVNQKKERFLSRFDLRAELTPRDLLSRAVFFEKMNGPVYLTMSHLEEKEVKKRFPNILKWMKKYDLDLSKDLIPITPVAHYSCGGIPVDLYGNTNLCGLIAVGEVACTGVHGANRLASNSLLEAIVFSQSLADNLSKTLHIDSSTLVDVTIPLNPSQIIIEDIAQAKAYGSRLSETMWEKVGIVRTTEGLTEAKKEIEMIPAKDYRVQHRQLVCYKIIDACLTREDSLGCHYITT